MPLRKILLRVIALTIFVIFIVAFVRYYSKPVAGNGALAHTFVSDTTGKLTYDSGKLLRTVMSSSKSIILVKEKPLPVRRFYGLKNTTLRIRMDIFSPVKKDTLKNILTP